MNKTRIEPTFTQRMQEGKAYDNDFHSNRPVTRDELLAAAAEVENRILTNCWGERQRREDRREAIEEKRYRQARKTGYVLGSLWWLGFGKGLVILAVGFMVLLGIVVNWQTPQLRDVPQKIELLNHPGY